MDKNKYRKKTEKFFDEFAQRRKKNMYIPSKARDLEFDKFFRFLNLKKGSSVVELGSGYGKFVLGLLKRGHRVTGVDISKDSNEILLQIAKEKKLDKNLTLLCSDFSKPPYHNKFDGAYCISTFHLLASKEKDRVKILANLVEAIKENGTIVLIEPNPLNPFFYPFYLFSDQASWNIEKTFLKSSEKNLRKIFKKLRLENIEVSYFGFLPIRFINSFYPVYYVNKLVNNLPLVNNLSSFIYIKATKRGPAKV
ncbi:MAG: class I SAM-dependent methyltransferase [Candidatus Levyibacteriota bacterium]